MSSKAEYEQRRAAARNAKTAKQRQLVRDDAELFVDTFHEFITATINVHGFLDSTDHRVEQFKNKREKLIRLLCRDQSAV